LLIFDLQQEAKKREKRANVVNWIFVGFDALIKFRIPWWLNSWCCPSCFKDFLFVWLGNDSQQFFVFHTQKLQALEEKV
jgi:hypothetical protein